LRYEGEGEVTSQGSTGTSDKFSYSSIHEQFLCNIECTDGDALSITKSTIDVLTRYNVPKHKIVALATDGAPVMVGRRNMVAARLKVMYPQLVAVHCHAHKLMLCISQAADRVSLFSDIQNTLIAIYQWFWSVISAT
jgi:hypothetical protein